MICLKFRSSFNIYRGRFRIQEKVSQVSFGYLQEKDVPAVYGACLPQNKAGLKG